MTDRITRLLVEVGNDGPIKRSMDQIVVVLLKDLTALKPVFLSSLIACVKEIPIKTTVYGCLTGILNLRDSAFVQLIVDHACDALDDAIKSGDFKSAKLMMRYIGELVNAGVISAQSYLHLIETLLAVLQSSTVRPQLLDAIVSVVLGSLPWSSYCLSQNDREGLNKVVAIVEVYMNRRRNSLRFGSLGHVFDALKVYRDCPETEPYVQVDKLENLWMQILDLRMSNWDECLLMRPENALFVELSGGTKHELKDFEMPAELDFNMSEIPTQEPIFWVFDDSVNTPENILANLPPTHKIERYIMDDLTLDTIHLLSHNHIEAAHFLLNMDKFHKDTDFSFHQCHVENLIRELIKLPVSQELEIYYATLLFDLCKGAPGKVPSAMGRSLRIMFARMDNENVGSGGGMDVECVKRLGEWFSHHLSNFSFLWKWHEWDFGLQDPSSAKFSFIRETLDREIRLSYYDRIAGTVPEVFMNHESVFPKTAPSFNYKYGSDFETTDKDLQTLLSRLHRELTSKADSSTVSSVLEDILAHRRNTYASAMTSDEMLAAKPAVVWSEDVVVRDIFVQNILFLGTKSFSHFLNVVERYVKILQQFNEQPEHKLRTVRIIADFWKDHTLNLEIVLDKLMNYRIIDPTSIISWVLDMDLLETEYSRWHIWTILRNVTAKVNSKVSQLRKKIGVDAMEEDDSATQEALDQAIRDQKAAFIDIFKKFQECLLQVQAQGEGPGSSAKWRWISGEMREFGRHHHAEIHKLKFTLEATAFIEPLESHVGKIWNEIKALGDLLAMQ